MSSTWGERIKLSIFGESHAEAIGINIDGLPAGESIEMEQVLLQMARRAPGQDPTATQRKETDIPKVLCGMLDGILTGAPLCAVMENAGKRSSDYEALRDLPRPGHADYTAFVKYRGHNDISGGGHFSGRLTAPLMFAGSVARQILERRGIVVGAHVQSIGASVNDRSFDPVNVPAELINRLNKEYFPVIDEKAKEKMYEVIESARLSADSIGGVVECAVSGLPAGLGEPIFDGAENLIASIVFGIPAVKGVEFGAGFGCAQRLASENNDSLYFAQDGSVKTRTNNAGGILGGITNGMPVIFRAAFKPTPSIGREQDTVDLKTGENAKLVIKGRHDPCIVPRAAPVVEAAACIAVLELLARNSWIESKLF